MRKQFSDRQLEIMKILWESDKPLIASDFVKRNKDLNINTVQACLRVLTNIKAIKVADIVYSGTVLSRSYIPLISQEEYINNIYHDLFGKDIGRQEMLEIIYSMIRRETKPENLDYWEELVARRRRILEREAAEAASGKSPETTAEETPQKKTGGKTAAKKKSTKPKK